MPLHDYIKKIYETSKDSAYIVRFLDYLILKRYKRTTFIVNDVTVEPLITGVLENVITKEKYKSLAQFYNAVTGAKVKENDICLLAKINVTQDYHIMRIVCNIDEDTIIDFVDQRYRTFLMYREIRHKVKQYLDDDELENSKINLWWNDTEYKLWQTTLEGENIIKCYELLEMYENKYIKGLYYCDRSHHRYLISDT